MEMKTNILIVDDDLSMSETLSDILIEKNYSVTTASEAQNAIEIGVKYDFDIILMDIRIPKMNGVEIFKKIKSYKPSVKVILMTAYSVEDLVEEGLKEGAYGIINKPLNIKKLFDLIEKIKNGPIILIVDDDPQFCESFRDALEEMKYKITVKYTGEQAIEHVKGNDVDLIFLDIKMPLLNGLETYLAIKKIRLNITAVMITAYGQEPMVVNLIEMGSKESVYSCLYKPLKMNKVITLINEVFRKKLRN